MFFSDIRPNSIPGWPLECARLWPAHRNQGGQPKCGPDGPGFWLDQRGGAHCQRIAPHSDCRGTNNGHWEGLLVSEHIRASGFGDLILKVLINSGWSAVPSAWPHPNPRGPHKICIPSSAATPTESANKHGHYWRGATGRSKSEFGLRTARHLSQVFWNSINKLINFSSQKDAKKKRTSAKDGEEMESIVRDPNDTGNWVLYTSGLLLYSHNNCFYILALNGFQLAIKRPDFRRIHLVSCTMILFWPKCGQAKRLRQGEFKILLYII